MIKLRRDDLLIVGITADNIMKLVEDQPMVIYLDEVQPRGGTLGRIRKIAIVYKRSFEELLAHFVETGVLSQDLADQVREPEPGEKRVVRPD